MKYIAFIVLGLVLLAAIGGVVLWANMPAAKFSVHAVRPTGTNFVGDEWEQHEIWPWPVWEVAITNRGRGVGRCCLVVPIKRDKIVDYEGTPLGNFPSYAFIYPGQYTNVFIPLPSDSPAPWTIKLRYITVKSSLESRLSSWLTPFPRLRGLLPNDGEHSASDTWHFETAGWDSVTNVVTAH
jgi:hypothetical protein